MPDGRLPPPDRGIRRIKIPEFKFENPLESEGDLKDIGFETNIPESVLERLASLELIVNNPNNFIDKGGAGSVYRLSSEAACLKLFHPHKDVERRQTGINFIRREAMFTKSLETFTSAGVRSPRCLGFYVFEEHDGRSGILLEELRATNLQHILLGKAEAPSTFNRETYLDALYTYIDDLHGQKAIVHGDLFARNLMVDLATGLPRVIDFGESLSIRSLKSDERQAKIDEEYDRLAKIDDALSQI